MEAQDILDRAYLLIAEHDISRGHPARDKHGDKVMTDSKLATSYDAPGAIYRAALELGVDTVLHDEGYREAMQRFHDFVFLHYEIENLAYWSDQHDEEEIREMFSRISTPTVIPCI